MFNVYLKWLENQVKLKIQVPRNINIVTRFSTGGGKILI